MLFRYGSLGTVITHDVHDVLQRPYMCFMDSCKKRYARAAHLKRHYEQSHKANDVHKTGYYMLVECLSANPY